MKNRDDALLRRIIEYCSETEEAIKFFGGEDVFRNNKVFRNAACMPIMQIGELCKLVSNDTRESNPQIDWRGWCGVRDIMAHQYTNLDYKKTWLIIEKDLPKLKEDISSIISEIDKEAIERISKIMVENHIDKCSAEEVYHSIVDSSGVSINVFSDEKIVKFIEEMM